jgi:hypothetical protein
MSRQPLWDTACRLQGDMFNETSAIGGLTFSFFIIAVWGNAARHRGFPMRAAWAA